MKANNSEIEKFRDHRYSSATDGNNGLFFLELSNRGKVELKIIASDGGGWDHVSVSLIDKKRVPSWNEMCFVKDLFFDETETVLQFHPKKSEYVNNHPFCLHLWKKQGEECELPPSIFTGIK